jgi:PKD repeat protein
VSPYFRYHHNDLVLPNDVCPKGGSSVSGTSFAFSTGGSYPAEYRGALFFADYSRRCIWVIFPGADGLPDISKRRTFVGGATQPVEVQIGPGGDLFYVDFGGLEFRGSIRRIVYSNPTTNQPPIAVATANPTNGAAPLTVAFSGSGSSDPDGDALTYAWDLDGDGAFDDAASVTTSFTYTQPGSYVATLRVSDPSGATGTSSVTISAGNTPPTAFIDAPAAGTTWRVGDVIAFTGHATDPQSGTLPASALTWTLVLQHCPSTCHEHVVQTFAGVASGSFAAPDHEYPSHLELRLTARDSGGLTHTTTRRLDPQTVDLTFQSSPTGLTLAVGSGTQATPFTRTAITGSKLSISAPSPQASGSTTYEFVSWSDSGAQTHEIVANAAASYVATYQVRAGGPVISQVVARPGPGRVTITWRTDVPADSQVEYGTSTAYGSTTSVDRTLVTSHSVTIANLARKRTYFFKVLSRDAVGNLSSATGSFVSK